MAEQQAVPIIAERGGRSQLLFEGQTQSALEFAGRFFRVGDDEDFFERHRFVPEQPQHQFADGIGLAGARGCFQNRVLVEIDWHAFNV